MFKKLTLVLTFLSCSVTLASLETYTDVKTIDCSDSTNNFYMRTSADEELIEGSVSLSDANYMLSNTLLVEDGLPEASDVGVIQDFLGSGLNGYGGIVSSTNPNDDDNFTFGTLFILLDRALPTGQVVTQNNMTLVYVEAMTGRQSEVQVECTFSRD